MSIRYNISYITLALAIITAVVLPLVGHYAHLSVSWIYAFTIFGLSFWLYGAKSLSRRVTSSPFNVLITSMGLALLYPIIVEWLVRSSFLFNDYFTVRFRSFTAHSITMLCFQLSFIWSAAQIHRYPFSSKAELNTKDKRIFGTIGYLLFFIMFGYVTHLFSAYQLDTAGRYDLTDISSYSTGQIVFLAQILMGLAPLFIIGHKVTDLLQSALPNIRQRITYLLFATMIWLPFGWYMHSGFQLSIVYLAVFMLILLMDLYVEKPGNGYVWFIIWLLYFSSTASAGLLFSLNDIHSHLSKEGRAIEVIQQKMHHFSLIEGAMVKESKGWLQNWSKSKISSVRNNSIYGKYTLRRIQNKRQILIWAYPSPSITNGISLFSVFFIFSLLILVFIAIVNSIFHFLPDPVPLRFHFKSSLQERIQIIIISTIILTFIIIGYASIYFFKQRALNTNNSAILHEMQYIRHLLQKFPHQTTNKKWHDTFILPLGYSFKEITTEEATEKYSSGMKWLQNHTSGLYPIYDKSGDTLLAALSNSPNKAKFYFIERRNSRYYSVTPTILTNLINVYVFLFLIAYSVVIAMSNSISWPLKVLGDRLKSIRLNKKNEKLDWPDNDEIGQLINNYNEMLTKLHESAEILAKTERDNAWREMAKQVAHEIKNPLTPMKLSIQYLKQTAHSNPESLSEMVERVSKTMIEQIDNLSSIATEFSNFAKMPNAKNDKLILNDVVISVHNLFRKREDINIQCYLPIDDIYVFADKEQLLRVLNNLLKNAIQSIPIKRHGEIIIKLQKRKGQAIISIQDNGIGIPEDMKSKIFEPNFTTKSSGTGLGLAMCRSMIEGFNGRIHFESKAQEGTIFFVEIPMMRLEDNYKENNRIILT